MRCPPNNLSRLSCVHTARRGIHGPPPMFEISHSQTSRHHVSQLQALASDWVFIVVIQEFSVPLQPPLSLSTSPRLGRPKLDR